MNNSSDYQQLEQGSFQIVSSKSQQIDLVFMTSVLRLDQQNQTTIEPNSFFALSSELILKILDILDIKTAISLVMTSRYFGNPSFDKLFLSQVNPDNFQNQATFGYIAEIFNDEPLTYFNRCVELVESTQKVPGNLSIHMFTNLKLEKIQSNTVHSMIIQLHNGEKNYSSILCFLKSLLQKKHFENLRRLKLIGIPLNEEFILLLAKLNLTVLGLKNFLEWDPKDYSFLEIVLNDLEELKSLYITHPHQFGSVQTPLQLDKALVYCPKSSEKDTIIDFFYLYLYSGSFLTLV